MHLTSMRLVTVIASDDLERTLTAELMALGATGYTVMPARGEGHHGIRSSSLEGANVRIEAIVDDTTADRIVEHLHAAFQPRHALVLYVTAVQVIRGDKFVAPEPAA